MDWVTGMQRAIDYVEAHLTEDVDYDAAARESFSSPYHFQRVFSILCGYTLGEYIRSRRLALAGAELAEGRISVIDAALKYGYESPDSFARAFRRFHGVNPSQAREGATLKSFSRLSMKISLEGGSMMDYRIEQKPELVLTGFKRRFTGTPAEREDQECDFYLSTRGNQYMLKGMARDLDTFYNVMTNFGDDGYDFYIAAKLREGMTEKLGEILGAEDAARFETVTIPARQYLVCETERAEYPTELFADLRRRVVSEWLPSSGYELAEAPEVSVYHWYAREGDDAVNHSRFAELWLPVGKRG
ncbi:MAG: AraC family transcriptional regulator [Ruminococcaceae bacterium]|nr:AraC family transcriptional regulator [Oscillospiraceae bacterium]